MAPSQPPRSSLAIQVLGRLTATRDGQQLDLGGPRQRAVLGILLAARRAVIPAARMIDLIWDESPPQQASGALQAYVSHLRRQLEPARAARAAASVLVSEGPGYALRVSDEVVDAWRFEAAVHEASRLDGSDPAVAVDALRDALALWSGLGLRRLCRPAVGRCATHPLRRAARAGDRPAARCAAGQSVRRTG